MLRIAKSPHRLSETQGLGIVMTTLMVALLTAALHLGPVPAGLLASVQASPGSVTGSVQ